MSVSELELSAGGRSWRLRDGETALIGRGSDASIMIDDPMVSRIHARVFYDGGWWIGDERSGNGLWVNGHRVERHRLGGNDAIALGDPTLGAVTLTIQLNEVPGRLATTTGITRYYPATGGAASGIAPGAETTGRILPPPPPSAAGVRPTAVPTTAMLQGPAAHPVLPPDSEATQWRLPKRGLAPSATATATVAVTVTATHGTGASPGTGTRSIGRGSANDIPVQDVLASRRHALLHTSNGQVLLEDLGSLNGTYVNDLRLTGSIVLNDGDRVVIGNSDFTVALAGQNTELRPRAISGGLLLESVGFTVPVGRKTKALLTDVEFQAATGELVAVIGPSGAGKSTLMNVMTGANAPSSGALYFDEHDITRDYAALRSRIGFVPQEDIIHRGLTVRQALGYASRLRLPADTTAAERRERTEEVMETLGLLEHADTRVSRLSGGQRKRASVALELLTEPSLLILDEPTSGLDPAMDKAVTQMLRTLADAGRVVVVVTHNTANLGMCDKVLVLAKGGLPAYVGPPQKVLEHFGATDWAELFTIVSERGNESYEAFRAGTPRLVPRTEQVRGDGHGPAAQTLTKAPRRPWGGQIGAIAGRQLRLLLADRGYFLFLAALPIVLGVLALVVPGTAGFGVGSNEVPREASQLLMVLIFGAAFLGMALSVRDLVGERSIFMRERSVGLDAAPYLIAKSLVFTGICLLQSAVLTSIVLLGKPAPVYSLFTYIPGLELFAAIALTAISCAFLGLLISAWVKSSDQVMPLLVIGAMIQLVLSGGIIPVTGRAVLEQVSWLAPSRWGFSAGASSMDLKALAPGIEDDWFWAHEPDRYLISLGALVAIGLLCWIGAWIRLARASSAVR